MASYQDNPKVVAAQWDVKEFDGNLYGCIHVKLTYPLTESEEIDFKDWLAGQCSDGFGEGMEQREIAIDEGEGFVNFWNSNHNWFMKNEKEFNQMFNQKQSMRMGGM